MSHPSSISSGLLAAGTTTVVSRKSRLCGVLAISDGTNAATVVVYDNTAGSGTVLAKAVATSTNTATPIMFVNPAKADIGITVVVSGTGSGAVIYYDA